MRKLVLVFLLFNVTTAAAVEITSGDYQGRADVVAFVERMVGETSYTEAELIALFAQVEKQEHLFALLDRPAGSWYRR